ncbi:hypothetical protein T484DRAFT_1795328 [Baffinella frigidus]|nr:hypothetical protein T484DRAFT_1795328 [Cryptophyta sp. CCMP2293]
MAPPGVEGHWEEGHFLASVQQRLLECSRVLNGFDRSAQHRLGTLHDKISRLERSMLLVEARLGIAAPPS